MKETKQDIINKNDLIGKFCTENIILTDCPKDKLKLDDIYNEFKNINKTSYITLTQFSTYFKDKYHENWNADIRFGKARGGFIKMQFYLGGEDDEQEDISSPLDANTAIQPTNHELLVKENAELKSEIEQLKKKIEALTKQQLKPEVKEEIKPEIKEEIIPDVKLSIEDAIKKFEKDTKDIKLKKNKSTFTMDDLKKKVKVETALKEKKPIEDIDDGYDTDELESSFLTVTKQLKSKK
jgi:hypothetical protein